MFSNNSNQIKNLDNFEDYVRQIEKLGYLLMNELSTLAKQTETLDNLENLKRVELLERLFNYDNSVTNDKINLFHTSGIYDLKENYFSDDIKKLLINNIKDITSKENIINNISNNKNYNVTLFDNKIRLCVYLKILSLLNNKYKVHIENDAINIEQIQKNI